MRKKKGDNVIGRAVMVHPFLTTDPIGKQGEIGKVSEVSLVDKDVLTVQFKDGKEGKYMADGLLTLNLNLVTLQAVTFKKDKPSDEDQKSIIKVFQLATEKKYDEALKLAITNDVVQRNCLMNCHDWMEMKNEQAQNKRNGLKR